MTSNCTPPYTTDVEQIRARLDAGLWTRFQQIKDLDTADAAAMTLYERDKEYGKYHVLEETPDYAIGMAVLNENKRMSLHIHNIRASVVYVKSGVLRYTIDGGFVEVPTGGYLMSPTGVPHRIANGGSGDLVAFELLDPPLWEDKHIIEPGFVNPDNVQPPRSAAAPEPAGDAAEASIPLARRMSTFRPSQTKAVTRKARDLVAQGRDIIVLSQGELNHVTPDEICNAGARAIADRQTRYTDVEGIAALRDAISKSLKRELGLDYAPSQITVGCGAKQGLFNALMATLDPGDEVVVPTPCWPTYPDLVSLVGGTPVTLDCPQADGFKFQPQALEACITPRTKWLLLNSPSNPTGAVYDREELVAIAEVLRRYPHVSVLLDSIYERIVYGGAARAPSLLEVAPDLRDRVLLLNGYSKAYAMTGWRVGYAAGPPPLIAAMNKIQGQTTSHTSSISQHAALAAALSDDSWITSMVSDMQRRRDLVIAALGGVDGLAVNAPDGAFYFFLGCGGLIGRQTPDGQVIADDIAFAGYLLDHARVAVVPGQAFLGQDAVRLSFCLSEEDLAEACRRIAKACSDLAVTAEKTRRQWG